MSGIKLHHVMGLAEPKRGDVGLELEVEGLAALPVVNEKSWKTKSDDSLRGFAAEYVNNRPIPCDHKKLERIKYLTDKLNDPAVQLIKDSPRTSLHVHVNVTGLSPVQVWNVASAYWLVENLLTKYCGEDTREGNYFCLRLADAEAVMGYIANDLKRTDRPFRSLRTDKIRYMGQNLKAIGDFGSLEYRAMRGTTDPHTIDKWSNELINLRNKAALFDSPATMLDAYYKIGPEEFSSLLFSPQFISELRAINNCNDLIDENVGLVCELAYFHDWTKWLRRIEENFKPVDLAPPEPEIDIDAAVNPPVFANDDLNIAGAQVLDFNAAMAQLQAAQVRIQRARRNPVV